MNPKAQQIIDACEASFELFKGDCSDSKPPMSLTPFDPPNLFIATA